MLKCVPSVGSDVSYAPLTESSESKWKRSTTSVSKFFLLYMLCPDKKLTPKYVAMI